MWPDGLAHYVELHGVKLPDEFLEHARQVRDAYGRARIDETWWLTQTSTRTVGETRDRQIIARFSVLVSGLDGERNDASAIRELAAAAEYRADLLARYAGMCLAWPPSRSSRSTRPI
jgi:hypothetical protein